MKILVKAVKMPGIGPNRCRFRCGNFKCRERTCEKLVVDV